LISLSFDICKGEKAGQLECYQTSGSLPRRPSLFAATHCHCRCRQWGLLFSSL